jgi:hypothetical protein
MFGSVHLIHESLSSPPVAAQFSGTSFSKPSLKALAFFKVSLKDFPLYELSVHLAQVPGQH